MTVMAAKVDETDERCGAEDIDDTTSGGATSEDSRRNSSWKGRVVARRRLIAVCLSVVTAAALVAALYFGQYRADQQISAAETAVVSAASQGAAALLSYAPDSLDRDLAAAQTHLTGEFLTYYREFADQIVAPAAKQRDVHAAATTVRSAPVEVHADHAKVLLFLDQTTTSRDNPDPVQSASSVMVGLAKVDGHWLISSLDPL